MRNLLPVLAVCALAGCGSPQAAAPSSTPAASTPAVSTPAPETPSPTPSPSPTREPTTKVKDCYDGDCLLKLSKPVTIWLNAKKFYYPKFEIVAVKADRITFWVEYPHGGGAEQTLGEGGGSSFSFRDRTPVDVTLVSIRNGRAVLSVSPGKGR
ncbi:hypothetical protein ACIBEJ_04525 [Nonomuraea sp. NPDC050790]|uniref:hypothetical protein n=1 Tax=Nonomuraea sp. NPDC050790 TaxID=3364371 RepID=UPI003794DEF4